MQGVQDIKERRSVSKGTNEEVGRRKNVDKKKHLKRSQSKMRLQVYYRNTMMTTLQQEQGFFMDRPQQDLVSYQVRKASDKVHYLTILHHNVQSPNNKLLELIILQRSSLKNTDILCSSKHCLTLILLMWRTGWAPNNARNWQMGFNSAFKGLKNEQITSINTEHFKLVNSFCTAMISMVVHVYSYLLAKR